MSKHFDELLAERGMKAPYPRIEAKHEDINALIRKAKESLADAEWDDCNYKLLTNKRAWLQFLLMEKRRGVERFVVGLEPVKEITYEQ